jgi:hypothetical protein
MYARSTHKTVRTTYRIWRVTGKYGLHELVLVVLAFLVYFSIRAAVVSRAGDALVNAYDVIAFEKALGIYWEHQMQAWILDHYLAIRAMNWIYFWGHMPVIAAFAVWLYFSRRRTYVLMRNAFLLSGALAVVVYATYPLAPPRLVPFEGFVDTMAIFDRVGYQMQETEWFVNPYAAMPSMHFGWAMLLGGAVAWVGRRLILTVLGIAWPIAMFFSIVLTGNHFIVDAVAGGIVAFAGLGLALGLERARPHVVAWMRARIPGLEHAMVRD